MYLIFLDTETTGLNPEKHRILEIAYKVINPMNGETMVSYSSVIAQPDGVWAEADPASLAFTGFSWEKVLHGKTEQVVSSEIINDLNRVQLGEKGGVFICQNPSFDRAFFIQLISVDLQTHFGWPYHWLDLASMYWAVRLVQEQAPIQNFKESDLSKDEIAKHYALACESRPHRAMNGVQHLITCYEAIFGKFKTPKENHV